MKKILIIGAKGQLGTALSNLFIKENISFEGKDLPEFDITSSVDKLARDIVQSNAEIIINCASYNNVYTAEKEPEKAMRINGYSLKSLTEICNRHRIFFCHISTDYVFDGTKNEQYIENDIPNPINMYGLSKYFGEKIIQNYCDRYCIIRTAALYGRSINGTVNIVDKLISIAKNNPIVKLVSNEFTSPTYAEDLANQIFKVISLQLQGIVHSTSESYCNWSEFGEYIFSVLKLNNKIEKVKSQDFHVKLKKPLFSVLRNAILNEKGINIMPDWKNSVSKYIQS